MNIINNTIDPQIRRIAVLIFFITASVKGQAQLNPMSVGFFQNQYLNNPAMAGLQQQMMLNAGLRQQFSTLPGLPFTQFLTADYGFGSKSAVGLQLNNDKAGLMERTRALASYAYHLPLNDGSRHLSFGLSMSFAFDNISLDALRGDDDDQEVYNVNQREAYLDADFGMAYRSKGLQVQGVLTNMKQLMKKDDLHTADLPLFFTSISYRIPTNFATAEPKVVYRGVKGFRNLLDAGLNIEFNSPGMNKVSALVMYHNAGSVTFGIGTNWNSRLAINSMYTSSTSPLQGYTSGDFELNVSYSIFNK